MNRIKRLLRQCVNDQRVLAWWTTLALIVPNVILDITEPSGAIWKFVNVALPLGCYMMWTCASKRTGLMTLLALPVMILAAFQIVLTYLYGESIIAVDMFLNVVTTNISEANELLSNMFAAILTVVALYLPPLVLAIASLSRRRTASATFRRRMLSWGLALALSGTVLAAGAGITGCRGSFVREVFPVNVCANMATAVERTQQTARYPETSAMFRYNSSATHPADEREIYLMVIGETSRAINWQLGGYERATNPRLSREANVVFCRRSISESNTTHKSVPMLMSPLSAEQFDSIPYYKSVITAMKEAGFHTSFLSNQAPNRSYTEFFGNEADNVLYNDFSSDTHPYDTDLLGMLREAVADTVHRKQFIVMHSYGSHFLYRDRYPRVYARYQPDDALDAKPSHRADLINAYDNTILFTDSFLAEAIGILSQAKCRSAMLYSSDHGEDIFDDSRARFLHASPTPTYYQLHVATLVWLSDSAAAAEPNQLSALRRNAAKPVSPQKSLFHTLMDVAGVESPYFNSAKSLASDSYTYTHPVYLTDLNMAVPIEESGVKKRDIELIDSVLCVR